MRKIKRFALVLLMALATCFSMFALSSCDMLIEKGDREEKHTCAFGEWVVTKEATCTAEGKKTQSCECGETITETIPMASHTIVTVEGKAATCQEAGLTEGKECSVCGYVKEAQEVIPQVAHVEVTILGEAATCTKTGWTDGKKCSVCDTVTVARTATPMAAHTEKTVKGKAATCTATGLTDGKVCSVCDKELVKQTEIAMKAHTEVVMPGKAATCTETGLADGKKCSVCGTITLEKAVTPKLGHNMVKDPAVAATCTTTGWTEGKHCTRCDEMTIAREQIPATGHKHNDGEVTTAPTCTAEGVMTFTCKNGCGNTYTQVISATGHDVACANAASKKATCRTKAFCGVCGVEYGDVLEHELAEGQLLENCYEVVQGMPASCTEPGFKDYVVCTYEGCGYTTFEAIPALGHTWGVANVEDNGYLPTCTEEGREKRETCTVCGATQGWEVVPALGHTEEILPAVQPTCIKTGLTEGKKCTVCKVITVAQEEVPVIAHDMKEKTITEVTCMENGLLRYTCSMCGLSEDKVVGATGHMVKVTPEKPATCDQDGKTESKICTVCNEVLKAEETIPAIGHNYVETVKLPTCTEKGLKTFTCSNEGCNSVNTEEIPALGHDVDCTRNEASRKANCMQGAFCGDCGVEYTGRRTDHEPKLVAVLAQEPTCTTIGWANYWYCAEASCGYTSYKEIPATGHDVVVYNYADATCTEKGHEAFEGCTKCGMCDTTIDGEFNPDKTFAEISWDALGHDEVIDAAVEAQCGADGKTEGKHCARCEVVLVAQEVVPASSVAHTFNVTTLEDCEVGIFCTLCSYVEVEPAEHVEEVIPEVLPTCTTTGLTEGKKCSVCQKILVAQETVDMLAHAYDTVGVVTTEPTCTVEGVRTYTCKDCPAFYTEPVDALGHVAVAMDEVAKTCTTSGWTGGEKCERCNEVLVAQEEVPASHEFVKVPEKMPTCSETGYSAHQECKDCGETTEYTEYPMHAHDYVGGTCQICLKKKDSAE